LRQAGIGPAGEVVQSSLEASTVDIAQEFTDMIIVQRAYSAATKIISTADEMLDELGRIKR
jgi:flagellar hook protein FlgE